ncbi:uncharacterized protein LOC114608042 [Podarcis muralis]
MRLSSSILFLGCWLTRQWQMARGEFGSTKLSQEWERGQYTEPSISVNPSPNVALGGNFYIQCRSPHYGATFDLYKGEPAKHVRSEKSSSYTMDFFISEAKLEHGGIYHCRYCFNGPCSYLSDRLYINVTASPKPSISVSPGEVIALEGNASIHCKTEKQQEVEFTLHIKNSSNTYESKKMGSGEVLFPIINAKESDGGIYRCRYCLKLENTQECSSYSDEVHIKVTGGNSKAGHSIAMWAGIAAGVFLSVLFLLILAFVLSRKRKKGSVANERTQQANIPLQSEPEEDPDGVSYAVLSHSSLKTKPAPDANGIPESCTYATVAQRRTKEVHELHGQELRCRAMLHFRPCSLPRRASFRGQHTSWGTQDYRARCSFIMRLSFNILFIGFLLAGQWQISGGQNTGNSKPSISKGPINVNPGEDINLECKSGYLQSARHFLYKGDSDHSASATRKIEKDAIVFHISNAKESDGGIYRCKYCHNGNMCSDFSDGVQVNIKGTANPKPSISVSPADAEIAQNEVWEKGENMKKSGVHSIAMWAGIAAGVFLLVLLLLLLAFILSKKREKGSTANEQAQQVNIPLQSEPEEDPDGVSYAVLSHSSLKTKPAPDADGIPESCTYATVAKGRTKEGQ